ncbi:signal peptidase II [Parolsenella catena]|uniref:signal peptidase II n=1 Tax=Parolsenella catena TaxID=2003188 RepID=UPI002FDD9A8A
MSGTRRIAAFGGVAALAFVLDQVSKAWARTALAGGPAPLVPGVLDLSLVMNTGAAFSIGSGSTWVFVILALVICAGAAVWVIRERQMPTSVAAALGAVAGGGVGNLIDRVVARQVTDFLATTFIDFPVFNVADIFVTCGVVIALVLLWRWDAEREGGDEA